MENEKEISWFKFVKGTNATRKSQSVGVSISGKGILRFNQITGQRLNLKPSQPILMAYVKKENWIIIKLLDAPEEGWRALALLPNPKSVKPSHVTRAISFLKHFNIKWDSKTLYEVDRQISTGFIVINLNKIVDG